MMAKEISAIWEKRGRALLPANEAADDEWRSMPNNGRFVAKFRSLSPRSLKQLRLFWGLMEILVDHEIFPNRDSASDVMKIASGHCDIRVEPTTGEVHMVPRSISFEKLDQPSFTRIFEGMIGIIVKRYLAGTSADELRAEVFAALDPPNAIGRMVA